MSLAALLWTEIDPGEFGGSGGGNIAAAAAEHFDVRRDSLPVFHKPILKAGNQAEHDAHLGQEPQHRVEGKETAEADAQVREEAKPAHERIDWTLRRCPHLGCGLMLPGVRLQAHIETCEWRTVECGHAVRGCRAKPRFMELAEHEATCHHMLCECPNKGCQERYLLGDTAAHQAVCGFVAGPCPYPGADIHHPEAGSYALEATCALLNSAARKLPVTWIMLNLPKASREKLVAPFSHRLQASQCARPESTLHPNHVSLAGASTSNQGSPGQGAPGDALPDGDTTE